MRILRSLHLMMLTCYLNGLPISDLKTRFSCSRGDPVTGLTLRHLKLTVADALRAHSIERPLNGLVFHARSSTLSEWEAQQNQFRPGWLACLWSSCFPWHSPLRDENRLIDRPEIDDAALSECGVSFLQRRKQFLAMHSTYSESEDDWSPRFELSARRGSPRTHILGDVSP